MSLEWKLGQPQWGLHVWVPRSVGWMWVSALRGSSLTSGGEVGLMVPVSLPCCASYKRKRLWILFLHAGFSASEKPMSLLWLPCFSLQMSPRCANLALKHYLLKPVQRIPQYRLLLTGGGLQTLPAKCRGVPLLSTPFLSVPSLSSLTATW